MLSVGYYEKYSPLKDIDIDLAPSKRPIIFEKIREERGQLGLVQVATFGTEGTKSAIQTACRGYRSEEYPEGIDVDIALYMSSLIPQERGFLWDINDVVYGNESKGRKSVTTFIREVNQYPGLLDIIMNICGLVNKRGIHASGVILYGEDPYNTASFMRAPNGDLITGYDLHNAEAAGDTKYDFLVTEVSDKIIKCFELLEKDNVIEKDTLRNIYNKYLHPEILDTTDQRIWDHLSAGDVLDVFQFNGGVGLAIAKKVKPQNPLEMTAANAMMRLMSEKGVESQQDRYVRIKQQGIDSFDREMTNNHLPTDMIAKMHHYCDKYYGCCAIQEQMMEILMDVAHFSLKEANNARKVVAKKQMSKIPELRQQFYDKMQNDSAADYIWKIAVQPQLGYAFSLNHSLPYSFVGIQTIYLAINFNSIYWNTACLIVNSGATEQDNSGSTDYGKIAKAIGDIRSAGIKVSLIDINHSDFGFLPDTKNNQILFGMKGMLNVGDNIITKIIENRPYISPKDFLNKVSPTKSVMISLIKGGAFDQFLDRKMCMAWYLWHTCDKKSRLTLSNLNGLIKYGLTPKEEIYQLPLRVYEFNRYLKAVCKFNTVYYKLDLRAINFLIEIEKENLIISQEENKLLSIKTWEKTYSSYMDVLRKWIQTNQTELLSLMNDIIFKKDWDNYAGANANISAWEMETLCFYYHDHELSKINNYKYGFVDFFSLPEEPPIDRTFSKNGRVIPIYKLYKICGTCIAKNKDKSTVTLLTTTGVVEVKFRKEYFSLFNKQISTRDEDGNKHIAEKSWFNRGNMIIVMGIRRGDNFIAKKYASSGGHQLYKIEKVYNNGEDIQITSERFQGELESEQE